jgi:hypothetical protein
MVLKIQKHISARLEIINLIVIMAFNCEYAF